MTTQQASATGFIGLVKPTRGDSVGDQAALYEHAIWAVTLASARIPCASLSEEDLPARAEHHALLILPRVAWLDDQEIDAVRPAAGRISQRAWACHHAIDIAAPVGVPIYAAASGQVVKAGITEYPAYGRMIVVRHANGYQTLYGHLSASYVHVGEHVVRGEMIGRMGSTGRSTGSHLHFEIAKESWLLDPLQVLPQ